MSWSRRRSLRGVLAFGMLGAWLGQASTLELPIPQEAVMERFAITPDGVAGWQTIAGRWVVEAMPGAPRGPHVLVQRAVESTFHVIVAPSASYTDVDVSVQFKPMAGREDASGGIVFRYAAGRYYVVRANALEDNFRLYAYHRGRQELVSAHVQPPALGQWHTIRVVAVGEQIQAYLNGVLLLEHRDARYRAGQVGLWTKGDAITAFDDLVVRGVRADK